jgi:hypothetical protein
MCANHNAPGGPGKGKMTAEVLPDGRVKSQTGDLSGANHQSADGFLKYLAQLMGGAVEEQRLAHGHQHQHDHDHLKQ